MKFKVLVSSLLVAMGISAQAADRVLECPLDGRLGRTGHIQIKLMEVMDHPEYTVAEIRIQTPLAKKSASKPNTLGTAKLVGLISGGVSERGYVTLAGNIYNDVDTEVIINPMNITVQGTIKPVGEESYLSLMDSSRLLQYGYGLHFLCK